MLRATLAGATLAAASLTAQAGSTLAAVEHAAEIPLPAFELPASHTGIVEFAVCDGCEIRRVAASAGTSYLVNNRRVTFEAFGAAVRTAATAAADRSLVGLYFDAASKRLVRIALVAPLFAP